MSDSLRPHGLLPTRLFCPWNFPGKNTGVGCRSLRGKLWLKKLSLELGPAAVLTRSVTDRQNCTSFTGSFLGVKLCLLGAAALVN